LRGCVKPLSDALKIVTQEDIELAKKSPVRVADQTSGNDTDSTNLMGLLGDIDGLKNEIHERMRRIEAVKQAKSVLLEDAERTEALNRRLAEIGKAMTVAQSGIQAPEIETAEPVRISARESLAGAESRPAPVRVLNEGVALPWPRTEEFEEHSVDGQIEPPELQPGQHTGQILSSVEAARIAAEANTAFEAAFKRLQETEESRLQAWTRADEAVQEARRLLENATSQLKDAVGREEQATQAIHSAQEALTISVQSAQERLEEAERTREAARIQAWKEANANVEQARRLFEDATSQLKNAAGREEQATQAIQLAQEALTISVQSAQERLEEAERAREAVRIQAWKDANADAEEAKRLFENATSQLKDAVGREERASQEFRAAQEAVTNSLQPASERLEEAERSWKRTDLAMQEAKALVDQSITELAQARKREESIAANLQSVRDEFTTSYEAASQRLQEAEQLCQRGDRSAKDAQQLIDQTTAELLQARKAEETAAADLLSARQELTTAYQFAAVAAQRRLDAVDSFQKAARVAVFAVAASWVAAVWMGWFAFHATIPVWAPGALTVVVVLLTLLFSRKGASEA
jgi:uncharacterized lipoprotein YehR (DUF1307 family)